VDLLARQLLLDRLLERFRVGVVVPLAMSLHWTSTFSALQYRRKSTGAAAALWISRNRTSPSRSVAEQRLTGTVTSLNVIAPFHIALGIPPGQRKPCAADS
jgi:hypothetical protein